MTDDDRALLDADVKTAESWRPRAYQDSVGVWTVGWGTNLQELEIDKKLGQKWLTAKLQQAEGDCRRAFSWFDTLSSMRQRVLVEMAYNLGLTRLLLFKHMLAAIAIGDHARVVREMQSSRWHTQVGQRAVRLETMWTNG